MSVDHTKNIIEINDVSFAYGTHSVLQDIQLNIHEGDYLGLIGPNGGGKTTLIKLILGLLPLKTGSIKLFGQSQKTFHTWSDVGYVAQKSTNFDALFPITVSDVVSMGRIASRGMLHQLQKEDFENVRWALSHVGLEHQSQTVMGNLSTGQQQRVFIARALAQKPKIIFLDEPTSGIDGPSQEQFYLLLEKLNITLGISLVLVSHDIDVVINEVTEVACINQKLVYHGRPEAFAKGEILQKLYGKKIKFIVHGH